MMVLREWFIIICFQHIIYMISEKSYRLLKLHGCVPAGYTLAETQVWLEFAVKCDYLEAETGRELYAAYDNTLGKIVNLINNPEPWLLPGAKRR